MFISGDGRGWRSGFCLYDCRTTEDVLCLPSLYLNLVLKDIHSPAIDEISRMGNGTMYTALLYQSHAVSDAMDSITPVFPPEYPKRFGCPHTNVCLIFSKLYH